MRHCLLVALVLTFGLTEPVWAESGTAMPRVGKSCPSAITNPASTACSPAIGHVLPLSVPGSRAPLGITDRASTVWRVRIAPSRPLPGRYVMPRGYYRSGEYCVQNR